MSDLLVLDTNRTPRQQPDDLFFSWGAKWVLFVDVPNN